MSNNIEDSAGQPEISPAFFNKSFRQKEKPDTKYINTYLEDPEFLAFQEQMNKPEAVQVNDVHFKSCKFTIS